MQDLRDAFRALRASPIVSSVAILSLALGIGANTAIFSILDSLLLRSLPVKDPQELVLLASGPNERFVATNPIWEQIRSHESLFDGAFTWSNTRFNLSPGGQSDLVDGMWASGAIFDVLGIQPVLGRLLTHADDVRRGGPDGPVAVISYTFWQRRFGGAADAVGRLITVERVPFTIVGVAPPDFFGPEVGRTFDVIIPLGTEPLIRGRESSLDQRSSWWLSIMLRLKNGQSMKAAEQALQSVQPQIREATIPQDWGASNKATYLTDRFWLSRAVAGGSSLRDRYRRPMTIIMVVVVLVLLIACANIANLLLAGATARRHELSVRLALGASRWRIARQLLTESVVLSGAGAIAGLAFAYWGSRLLVRQLSTTTNNVFLDLSIDWRLLAFTGTVAIVTAMLFGTVPALRGTRAQPHDALKAQGRGVATEHRFSLANALVSVQVALSLVLLIAAGLFVRTFASLARVDLGFDPKPVLVATLNAQPLQLEPARLPELFRRMLDAASTVPGVSSAALARVTPVSGSNTSYRIEVPGAPDLPVRDRGTWVNMISPDWFRTYGTTMIAGRDFGSWDTATSPPVAIVNEAFARKFSYGRNPVGLRVQVIGFSGRATVYREIVGYSRDAVYRWLHEPIQPTMYIPYTQLAPPPSSLALSVRTASSSPAGMVRPLAEALTAVNRDVAITFRPLEDNIHASLTQQRVVAMLSAFFGGLALLLAALGLYGVTSYAVSRRRAEIGIRMALGAAPGGIVQMVLTRVAVLVLAGVVAGAAVSAWAARFVSTLLYGLQPRDPATFAAAAVILTGIAAAAAWLPARRAARIDPAVVLRDG